MAKKITVFEAFDGEIFKSKEDARMYEFKLELKDKLREHIQESIDREDYEGYSTEDVVDYIIENRELLLKLLKF